MKTKITTTINKKWIEFISLYIAQKAKEGEKVKRNEVLEKGLVLLKKEFENDK